MGPQDPRADTVIILTRLGGRELAVNPDLIERAEPTPDTVITMVAGHKLVVLESVEELVERVLAWRASVAVRAYALSREPSRDPFRDGRRDDENSGRTDNGRTDDDGTDDDGTDDEQAVRDISAHSDLGTTLARVLRLPLREE
jgi:flagellar protein FlbD